MYKYKYKLLKHVFINRESKILSTHHLTLMLLPVHWHHPAVK
jgi:hypothetical protein